ncbi:MAG TPA: SDR family oxidoreductase [Pirellulales bacterium]|jgi:pteridine reductase|nr:SDR family oxidoreductase [Pirellulales bacterium]
MRVALVTGSGRERIGWHVADALAERGWGIAVHYHTSGDDARGTVESLAARGVQARAFQADLSDQAAVDRMLAQVLERFGHVDALVNCAAIWKRKRLEDVTAADVREHFEINTLGTFLCCQKIGLTMAKQPAGGVIVNLGDWAERRPYLDYAAYFPSKGAIIALTRSMAVELASRNPRVRVNCVLPGPVMLPHDLPEAERSRAIEATLVRHEGSPKNVVQAVLYLIDNDFVTGDCIAVDGGRSIWAGGS